MKPYITLTSTLDKSITRSRKFFVHRLDGMEELSNDFSFTLSVSSLERLTEQELKELSGNSVTVKIAFKDMKDKEGSRFINGIVYRIKELGMSRVPLLPAHWRYELEIGSWLRDLDSVTDCRVFQKSGQTSIKIVTELLAELGYRDIRNHVKGNCPRREYAVLYNETVLNFIKRLLQEEKILWFFEHGPTRHNLVLTDGLHALPDLSRELWGQGDQVTTFFRETNHLPIKSWLTSAYDWENPPVKTVQKITGIKNATLPHFQYPGGFIQRKDGEKRAERSMAALLGNKTLYHGTSTVRLFTAGCRFKLEAPLLPDLDQKPFLLRSLRIEATNETFSNHFIACQAKENHLFFEDSGIAKPVIFGSQSATVVGETGKGKIRTDKHGRVKVRFHWDHHAPESATNTSAFIRVANPCTGSQRGFVFTPRIGEEVIVSFEDGDPDKPLILGSVYASDRKPPKAANSKPYRSIVKTGSETDANRITLDDTPGSEEMEINAKKDLNIVVGGNLDINVKDAITTHAKKLIVIVRKNIKVQAGGNILNLTLQSVKNTAGSDIVNMALGGVVHFTGGLVTNLAGCTFTNTAILSVENSSAGAIKGTAQTLLANTALNAVAQSGAKVENKANLALTNISKGGIINAAKDVKTDTLFQKVKIDEGSITETKGFKIKGLLSKIN